MLGRMVGRFRLVRLLGEGGMSSVYLGERADDFQQTAAVKVLREDLSRGESRVRFYADAQALASLQHPGIVGLIDGGITDDGIGYLVTDYLAGMPLDQFCDSRRLPLRARIEIMIQALDAVEYAHQRFLAHCDLKFSHILVTGDGRPHLLDFGLMKLLASYGSGPREAEATAPPRPLTPDFASPEQFRGQNLTTATDVYSAGVMLYWLLTGTHPFQSLRDQPIYLLHATLGTEVEPPSRRCQQRCHTDPVAAEQAATVRATTSARLAPALHGDLDAILLKALRKEPEQRYGGAALLAADLRNFLGGRPVAAHRGSGRYRAWKFIRRNRATVAAAGLLLLTLLAGIAGVFWEGFRARGSRTLAEVRFRSARSLTLSLLSDTFQDVQRLDGSEHARQLLLEWSRQALNDLARQCGDDAALQIEVADTYLQVGNLLAAGGPVDAARSAEALSSFDHGLTLVDTILGRERANPVVCAMKVKLLEARSRLEQQLGHLPESVSDAQAAANLKQTIAGH